jgi:hypothetical protein
VKTSSDIAVTLRLALLAAPLFACAPDLRVDHPFDGQVNNGPLVTVTTDADGLRHATVDASDKGSQVYMDLDQGREMKGDEAFSTNDWDLSFKRMDISMNGGGGNPTGLVRAQVLTQVPFDSLLQAPADGYTQDGAERVFNSVEGGWYVYDLGVHRLVAREGLVYVVQSSDGAYFKLQMQKYYGDSGTPAILQFQYASLLAP